MKQKIVFAVAIAVYSFVAAGCATIFKGNKSEVYFIYAPKDLLVYKGDTRLQLSQMENKEEYSFGDSYRDEMSSTKTTYYSPGIILSPVTENHTITLKSGGKTATVKLVPQMRMHWLWLNLFVGGFIVDLITGHWNDLGPEGSPRVVDVSKYLK